MTSIVTPPPPVLYAYYCRKKVYTPNIKDIDDFEITILKEYWLFIRYSGKYLFFFKFNAVNIVGTFLHINLVKLNSPLMGFYPTGFSHSLHFLLQHVQRHILSCINDGILITFSYLKVPQTSLTITFLQAKNLLTALLMNMLEYNVIIYGYGVYLH